LGLAEFQSVHVLTITDLAQRREVGRRDLTAPAAAAGEGEVEQGTVAKPFDRVSQVAISASNSRLVIAVFFVGRSPRLFAARRARANKCRIAGCSQGFSTLRSW
jgi:hypothetical protein